MGGVGGGGGRGGVGGRYVKKISTSVWKTFSAISIVYSCTSLILGQVAAI